MIAAITPEALAAAVRLAVQAAARQPVPALLDDDGAAALLGVGVRTLLDELRHAEWFDVRPVELGPRLRRWPRAELEALVSRMPRQTRPPGEPETLASARRRRIEAMKGAAKVAA